MSDRVPALVAGCALALAVTVGLVVVLHPGTPVAGSRVPAVPLPYVAPSYVAVGPDGLLIRSGRDEHVVAGRSARWLPAAPAGRVLLSRADDGTEQVVVDPTTGAWGRQIRTEGSPGAAGSQVTVLRLAGTPSVEAFTPDLTSLWRVTLPTLPTGRTYAGPVVTVGSNTYVSWTRGDSSGWVRIGPDRATHVVLEDDGVVSLASSADGAALLGIRNVTDPPCAGCVAPQHVVEIDPLTGKQVADYGIPGSYDPSWRVSATDKVGTRVAVRFRSTQYVGAPGHLVPVVAEEGTWVYDGDWSLVPGSRDEETWWQGPDDRVVARADPTEPAYKDGLRLIWLHDFGGGTVEIALPGELTSPGSRDVFVGSVPGQLLPPDSAG